MTSAGNAAGTGARIALLDRGAREEIERVVRAVEKVETAVEPRFQEHFVHAMAIPHDTDPYERLAGSVPLPHQDELGRPGAAVDDVWWIPGRGSGPESTSERRAT